MNLHFNTVFSVALLLFVTYHFKIFLKLIEIDMNRNNNITSKFCTKKDITLLLVLNKENVC